MNMNRPKHILMMTAAVLVLLLVGCGKEQGPDVGSGRDSVWDGSVATAFENGDGSESNPFQIKTPSQLAYLAQQVNGGNSYAGCHFEIAADMDLAGRSWTPIGTAPRRFTGNLDGKGHKILGLKVDADVDYAGLFGYIGHLRNPRDNGFNVVKNLVIPNAELHALSASSGILSGGAMYASISGCEVSGVVETKSSAGGLIGHAMYVEIRDCVSEVQVTASAVGALCCDIQYSTIEDCTVRNSILECTSSSYVGGLCASVGSQSTISRCTCDAEVRFGRFAGGLFGTLSYSGNKVIDCIARGRIINPSIAGGGFVGYADGSGHSFENCGFEGRLEGYKNLGTIVGNDRSGSLTFTGCWYDGTKVGGLPKVGLVDSEGTDYSGISDTKPSGV